MFGPSKAVGRMRVAARNYKKPVGPLLHVSTTETYLLSKRAAMIIQHPTRDGPMRCLSTVQGKSYTC